MGLWMLFSFGTVVAFLTVVMLSIHWRLEDVVGAWAFAPARGQAGGRDSKQDWGPGKRPCSVS